MTQEDGGNGAALAWLSASMTALRKVDGEKDVKKKIHCFFLNLVSLTDPSVQANREAAGCDELFSTSSTCIYPPLWPSLTLSWERKGFKNGEVVQHKRHIPGC